LSEQRSILAVKKMAIATEPTTAAADPELRSIADQKRVALNFLNEAWDSAISEGVEPDIVAHAALFTAIADLVQAYGEEAVAELARGLPKRINAFEFSVDVTVQ
jgi:hypothetical protein